MSITLGGQGSDGDGQSQPPQSARNKYNFDAVALLNATYKDLYAEAAGALPSVKQAAYNGARVVGKTVVAPAVVTFTVLFAVASGAFATRDIKELPMGEQAYIMGKSSIRNFFSMVGGAGRGLWEQLPGVTREEDPRSIYREQTRERSAYPPRIRPPSLPDFENRPGIVRPPIVIPEPQGSTPGSAPDALEEYKRKYPGVFERYPTLPPAGTEPAPQKKREPHGP